MKIAITGAGGQLGQAMTRIYTALGHELVCFNSERDLDITRREQVMQRIGALDGVDLVIHTAAYTNVDGAESDQDLAFAVNGEGTKNVALACHENGAALVYISTDYVFNGMKKQPYTENDTPDPVNVYGQSKLAGEQFVAEILDKFFIVRTSWLFGQEGKNFVGWVAEKALRGEEVAAVASHVGSPTFTDDLVAGILEIFQTRAYGTYHYTNSGTTTWYDWACYIFELLGQDTAKLSRSTWAELNRKAKRPRNSMLKLNEGLKIPPTWQTATKTYLENLKVKR